MRVKDQIKARREQLKMSVPELALRLDVSPQSVRHWESGRSYPGKAKAAALEQALSFQLDWTEGEGVASERGPAAMVDQGDIELLITIARLPLQMKQAIGDIARSHLSAVDVARRSAVPAPRQKDVEREIEPAPAAAAPAAPALPAAPRGSQLKITKK